MGNTVLLDNPVTGQAEVYRIYDKALETLCFRVLGEPWNLHSVEHRIVPAMLKGIHGDVIAECLSQFREYRQYSPQSVALALNRDKGLLLDWACRDSEIDLPFAFDSFLHAYEQWAEVQIADSVRAWVRDGLGSLEVRQASDKRRRELGITDIKPDGDGKQEFEERLRHALDGVQLQYPVQPPLKAIRAGVPFWAPGDYIVIAGRTGMGKSYFALNAIFENAKRGVPCCYINLENSPPDVQERLWQFETGEAFQTWRNASPAEISARMEAWEAVKKMPIVSTKPGNSLSAIVNAIRQAHYERGIQFAVVDYVQLVRAGGRDRVSEIEMVSSELRALALDLNICIAAVAQLNRESEKQADKRPGLAQLKGSGSLEQDATGVYLLYRPEYYSITTDDSGLPYPPGFSEVIIAKGRKSGPGIVQATFDPVRGFTDFVNTSQPFTKPAPAVDWTIPASARPAEDVDIPF